MLFFYISSLISVPVPMMLLSKVVHTHIHPTIMPPAVGGIERYRDPSVGPTWPGHVASYSAQCLGQLGMQHLGQATRAVWTADLFLHGRRSTAIGRRAYRLAAHTCIYVCPVEALAG